MADQNTHINYSIADIQRYLQGSMTAKEMHDMEKAALHDPFLADALEGYREISFDTAHQHLNEINASLRSSKSRAKVVTMPAKSFSWWKVAAMVILVVGAGVIGRYALNNNSSDSNKQLAQKTEIKSLSTDTMKTADSSSDLLAKVQLNKTKPLQPVAATPKKEVSISENEVSKTESKLLRNSYNGEKPDTTSLKDNNEKASDVAAITRDNAANASIYQSRQKQVKLLEGVSVQNNISFNGKIINTNNQPVPNASIKITGNDDSVATDSDGFFSFKSPDSMAHISVSSAGNNTLDTLLNSSRMNYLTVIEKPSWLSTIPVVKMESKKKAAESNSKKDSSSMPVGGWQSFQEYVYKKLHKEMDTTLSSVVVNGNVEIEFFVNDKGIPYDFKVIKSLDDESDAKAIEILKGGPRWITSKKSKMGKVTIQF